MAAATSPADISGRFQAVRMIVENLDPAGPTDEQAEVLVTAALDLIEGICLNLSTIADATAILATRSVTSGIPKDMAYE